VTASKMRSDLRATAVKVSASDADVVRAARVSTLGGLAGYSVGGMKDAGLINFLMRDRHGSPFEHTSFTFLVEAPIFVAREHMRHRAGWSYNEESGRYKELEGTFYLPPDDRPLRQVGKAGAYEFLEGTEEQWEAVDEEFRDLYRAAYAGYQSMLSVGVAREVARMVLPVGIFTSYYATCNARSLMHFLGLRTKDKAAKVPSFPQAEIEEVAKQMEATLSEAMPLTYAAFQNNGRVAP